MARQHRSHSVAFKRQVAEEFLAGETLHGLAKRHDLCRNLIRVWVAKYEAGAFDDDAGAADLIQAYEARIAALERRPASALGRAPKGGIGKRSADENAATSVITVRGSPSPKAAGYEPRLTFTTCRPHRPTRPRSSPGCTRSATSSKATDSVASAPRCATRGSSSTVRRSAG
jgi:transposase-like protein